jgi:hypothetical protein
MALHFAFQNGASRNPMFYRLYYFRSPENPPDFPQDGGRNDKDGLKLQRSEVAARLKAADQSDHWAAEIATDLAPKPYLEPKRRSRSLN